MYVFQRLLFDIVDTVRSKNCYELMNTAYNARSHL